MLYVCSTNDYKIIFVRNHGNKLLCILWHKLLNIITSINLLSNDEINEIRVIKFNSTAVNKKCLYNNTYTVVLEIIKSSFLIVITYNYCLYSIIFLI